ncbi:ABC transporter substrate-binding protein [Ruania zhangjianzhongii]|uniref:ABC transporter substrate-binding protein n=1 Tax=Ruania zhangjianzhongii TaxID=2603206 RepID=UPI001652A1C5|nr:extracellular solute-binding protein [Ruania zhangjianzhongii]
MTPKRSKAIRTASVVVAASMLLAACGGSDDGGGDGDTTVVTVWDRAGAEADVRAPFFEEWNETEGADLGIEVEYVPQAIDRYEELINQGFQTGRAPDIFHGPSSQIGAYVAAGWVAPLDGLIAEETLASAEQFLPDTSELVWGGQPYAIPTTTFSNRLMINRAVFEEAGLDPDDPPQTFSEVEEASQQIAENSGGEVYGTALPIAWVGFRDWFVDLHVMASNPDLTQNGLFNIATGEFESQQYQEVMEHYRTLLEEGWAFPGASTMDISGAVSAFAEGEVGMLMGSSGTTSAVHALNADIDLAAGPIPVADGTELVRSPMNAGFPYSISSTAEDQEAAATVLEVIAGTEMQSALAEGGVPPASQDAWEVAVEANPLLEEFTINETDEQWPKKPGGVIPVEGATATEAIEQILLEPSTDIATELDALQQRYQEAWDRGIEQELFDPEEFMR